MNLAMNANAIISDPEQGKADIYMLSFNPVDHEETWTSSFLIKLVCVFAINIRI